MSLRAKAANAIRRGYPPWLVQRWLQATHQRRRAQGIPMAGRAPSMNRGGWGRRRGPSKSQMERWEGQKQKRKERWKKNIINKTVRGKLPYSVLPEKWRGDYISAKKERLRKTHENVRRQYGDDMGKIPGHLTYHKGGTKGTVQDLNWLGPRTHFVEGKLGGTTIHIPKRFHMGGGKWDEEGIKKYVAYQKRTRKSDKKDWVSVQAPQGEESIHPTMLRHFRAQRRRGYRV